MKHALCLSLALLATAPALAATDNGAPLRGAWEDLNKAEGDILNTQQFAGLNNLAFQAAVVRACEGHTLNHARFGIEMDHLLADAEKTLPAPLYEQKKTAVLVAFGARFGLFLAEANQNKDTFCKAGAMLKEAGNEAPIVIQ